MPMEMYSPIFIQNKRHNQSIDFIFWRYFILQPLSQDTNKNNMAVRHRINKKNIFFIVSTFFYLIKKSSIFSTIIIGIATQQIPACFSLKLNLPFT